MQENLVMVPPVLLNGVGGGLYRRHGAHPTPMGCEEGCAVLKVPPHPQSLNLVAPRGL